MPSLNCSSRSSTMAPKMLTEEQSQAIKRLNAEDQPLAQTLLENGVKMTVEEIVGIWKLENPWQTTGPAVSIIWLEEGDKKAGLEHIMRKHTVELGKRNIGREQVVELVKAATMVGTRIGFQGQGAGRPIVVFKYHGEVMPTASRYPLAQTALLSV